METTEQARLYALRQLRLPTEYQTKLQKAKIVIANLSGQYPNMEVTICSLIDEFLSVHGVDTTGIEEGGE